MNHLSFLCLLLIACSPTFLISQNTVDYHSLWTEQTTKKTLSTGDNFISPTQFRTFSLATSPLQDVLAQAPNEQDVAVKSSPILLPLPMPDGTEETFRIVEYSMMEPALAAAFPEIKTYRGISNKNPHLAVRIDMTAHGFRAVMRTENGSAYIDPHNLTNPEDYLVYWKKDYPQVVGEFTCEIEELSREVHAPTANGAAKAGDCIFRNYRLAIATTGEYSNYHGATNATQANLVLSAVTTTINRVNQVFENDFAIRLTLIGNTTDIFYYDGASDPYTDNSSSQLINENQTNIDAVITGPNYDIGHVFSTGGGGLASLYSPCSGSSKARGVTGSSNPIGDPYDIDYVAHEIGHQFGAHHTQNNSCNRNDPTAVEPGSASTIMGYAGICSPNIQNNSDSYFHCVSISEVANFVVNGNGNSCKTSISSGNSAPTVGAIQDYSIPAATPFVLTANGSDANGDALTYNWEQTNAEITFAGSPPAPTNTDGPAFRSLFPVASPSRYFPNLTDLTNNVTPTWEVLPSVSRNMDFRVMVRDNSTNAAGCNTETDMRVTTNSSAGPFVVNVPTNTAIEWQEGTSQMVNWDVANTTAAPINCANVDILLSMDGGMTYPTTLVSNTANDGSESIVVPVGTTTTARIMVICSDNVFFDISNNDFKIIEGVMDYNLSFATSHIAICSSDDAVYTVNVGSVYSYSDDVTLSVSGLPAGVNANFSNTTVTAGNSTNLTINNTNNSLDGVYTLTLNGTASTGNKTTTFEFEVKGVPSTTSLNSPTDNSIDMSTQPTLTWFTEAQSSDYEMQLATDANFNNIVETSTTNNVFWTPTTLLDGATTYYWRVRGTNLCGNANWDAARAFTTVPCFVYNSTGTTPLINTSNATSTISVAETGTITDLNIVNIDMEHSWTGDLTIGLTSPNGTSVPLFANLCHSDNDVNITFDSDAINEYSTIPCAPVGQGGIYQPSGSLHDLVGQNINGDWKLNLSDNFPTSDGGTLNGWGIQVCMENYSALPVEWLNFTAIAGEESIDLAWITAQEVDNIGFDIERKITGENAFKAIEWVDAYAETTARNAYFFEDKKVEKGLRYEYRIRQIDLDGQESYSKIATAMILPKQPIITLFPNPTTANVHVQIIGQKTAATATVYNLHGQIIIPTINLDNQQVINLTTLPTGLYVVEIATSSTVFTEKILKN